MSFRTKFCVIHCLTHCFQATMYIFTLLVCAAALILSGCKPSDSPQKAITGATLVDGSGGPPVPDSVVVIDNGRITAAGPRSSTPVPAGFTTMEAAGKFIVPGLVDASVRIEPDPAKAAVEMSSFLRAGITSIGSAEKTIAPGPHVFPATDQRAGIADLVIASGGYGPEATLAKIERLAKAEIATAQVIQAATQNGGSWLKQADIGRIKSGARADLILLSADPLADIKNLHKIDRVMLDGSWISLK
jgi:imidazolonepropionase-like amidohydrolase